MKTSDVLKYPSEIDPEVALHTAALMRGLIIGSSEILAFESTLDVPTYMAAWEHLTASERAAWKAMVSLGKAYAGQ